VTERLTTTHEIGSGVTRERKRIGAIVASTTRATTQEQGMSLNTKSDEHVTIRFSRPDDAAEISKLAQLDSARPPQGRLLVAEVAGELFAALPINGGAAVADPFRHTLDLVSLLEVRRRQIRRTKAARRRLLRRYVPAPAASRASRQPS
jgi:hypothetical protein